MILNAILLDSNQDAGYIVLIVIFAFLAIGFIWLELIEKPKEKREQREFEKRLLEQERQNDIKYKKEYEELQSNKSPLLNSKDLLEHKVQVLSTNVPSCNKCSEDIFTVWEINNSTLPSVGIGLNFSRGNNFNARLDWGIPLVNIETESNSLQEDGIYFSLDYNFL